MPDECYGFVMKLKSFCNILYMKLSYTRIGGVNLTGFG